MSGRVSSLPDLRKRVPVTRRHVSRVTLRPAHFKMSQLCHCLLCVELTRQQPAVYVASCLVAQCLCSHEELPGGFNLPRVQSALLGTSIPWHGQWPGPGPGAAMIMGNSASAATAASPSASSPLTNTNNIPFSSQAFYNFIHRCLFTPNNEWLSVSVLDEASSSAP